MIFIWFRLGVQLWRFHLICLSGIYSWDLLGEIGGLMLEELRSDNWDLIWHLSIADAWVKHAYVCVRVQTLCEPCFPPHYNIVNRYIAMYHSNISQHVTKSCCVYNLPGMLPNFMVTVHNVIIYWLSASAVHDFITLLSFRVAGLLPTFAEHVWNITKINSLWTNGQSVSSLSTYCMIQIYTYLLNSWVLSLGDRNGFIWLIKACFCSEQKLLQRLFRDMA